MKTTLLLTLVLLSSISAFAESGSKCKLEVQATDTTTVNGMTIHIETIWNRTVRNEESDITLDACLEIAREACRTQVFLGRKKSGTTVVAKWFKKVTLDYADGALEVKKEVDEENGCEVK